MPNRVRILGGMYHVLGVLVFVVKFSRSIGPGDNANERAAQPPGAAQPHRPIRTGQPHRPLRTASCYSCSPRDAL
jgi:hypothetical protein